MKKLLLSLATLLVASVTFGAAHAQEVKGDALAGKKKIAMCIGCHGIIGFHASFPEVYKVPKISGQSAKYIASALAAYQHGERKHPTMRGIADALTQQDMADLAAYYSTNGVNFNQVVVGKAPSGSAKAMELVAKGGCVSCHGDSFSKPVDPSYPKIAGQYPDYLYAALRAYKTTDKEMIGRGNPIMGGIAKQFSNDELKELANYVGGLQGELKTVPEKWIR